jgi:cobalt-zinc-cadmium efflux system protein
LTDSQHKHEHDHDHRGHHHGHGHLKNLDKKRLLLAFCLVASMMAAEIIAGYISRSLALTSDGLHMMVDAFALGLAFWAARIAHRNERAEAGAALTNGVILALMAVFIFQTSLKRCFCPPEINCPLMIGVAAVGLAVNLIQMFILRRGDRTNINMRGAFFHVISDTLCSLGVISGGIAIYFTDFHLLDPILGFLLAILILRYGLYLIRDSLKLLHRK